MPIRVLVTDSDTGVVLERTLIEAREMRERDTRYSIVAEDDAIASGANSALKNPLDELPAFGAHDSSRLRR